MGALRPKEPFAALPSTADPPGRWSFDGPSAAFADIDDARAPKRLGSIDVWINNAGTNAYRFEPLLKSSPEDLKRIVDTNSLGLMLCLKEAMSVMREQDATGHIFSMDGAGATGQATPRFAAYGATKRAIVQLHKSLRAELDLLGIDNVRLHMLSPGMVATELLLAGSDTKVAKFMINALAETPEDAASFLVPRVRSVVSSSARASGSGSASSAPSSSDEPPSFGPIEAIEAQLGLGAKSAYIKFLTLPKAYAQILMRALLGLRKDRFVKED